ncbi:hypothetical protein SISNIDRAFT_487072 [Sistotremastrum niveocremeum HHB9708]|uniref:F-box domain-containing protein n=1 Tax=Sistotremastrum niveocremeum HHB9708 TaxID=1314777 RepID=A0A164SS94_9AGAM|nr:hypothetical protein SISNIDRAFT_487072 [Sistotremastrum niveocremeum HHB9708]
MGRLPDELILEILEYYKEDWEQILSLCSVCSKWRNVAINSSVLWSNILLPCPAQIYKLLRDRSKSSPLEISISWDALLEGHEEAGLRQAGQCLRELAPRISWLRIYWNPTANDPRPIQPFLSTYAGRNEFTQLKYLDLVAPATSPETISPLNMPSLETLRFAAPLSCIPQSINHITQLELDCFEPQLFDILISLAKFPLVEHLYIDNIQPPDDDDDEQDKPIVSLRNLRTLSVDDIHPEDMEVMLQHLEIPPSAFINWGVREPREEPSLRVSLERIFGSRMSSCNGFHISDEQLPSCSYQLPCSFTQTIKSKNGGFFSVSYQDIKQDVESAALQKLSTYPTDLSMFDWQLPWLPSLSILVNILTSWSSLTHIRICTDKDEFERLLSALEETPDIVCPVLEGLDCTGTRFSGVRMKYFLDFRHTNCRTLRELKISRGNASPPLEDFEPFVGKLIEVEDGYLSNWRECVGQTWVSI